uniref:NADH-ubiquinone oxidoreductase chain 3 n=1 Tax=Goniomonas avonlea TaxID=1255295 RepID=A0A348G6K6_9CRYP|nr:NADH dehydrogenase subunit 3 [Goniomonas avonlea]
MTSTFFGEYGSIFLFLFIAFVLSFIIFFLSFIIAVTKGDTEKLSAYECGFDPFTDSRNTFDVQFYLVGILFIIFDLEISFLFPWVIVLHHLPKEGIYSMVVFLGILTIGFIYEWQKGALSWE